MSDADQEQAKIENLLRDLSRINLSFGLSASELRYPEVNLVWQFVRYNAEYRRHYDWLTEKSRKSHLLPDVSISEINAAIFVCEMMFCQRWGVTSPIHYNEIRLPTDIFIRRKAVFDIPSHKGSWSEVENIATHLINEVNSPLGIGINKTRPIMVLIDPLAPRERIHRELDEIIEAAHEDDKINLAAHDGWSEYTQNPRTQQLVAEYFACHYFGAVRGDFEKAAQICSDLGGDKTGTFLRDDQIKARADRFAEISSLSPDWFFFKNVRA